MRILSLGAGVQSSTIAMMADRGELPKIDAAIFADTGWEPKAVYDWLEWLTAQLSYPVYKVGTKNLHDDLISTDKKFSSVPFYTEEGGMGRRQCTSEYKIKPVHKKIRELHGIEPRKHWKGDPMQLIIGISLDEIQRMKPSRVKWIKHEFPLIKNRISRYQCLEWFDKNNLPEPPKSSCIGCPFHSNEMWSDIYKNAPEEFQNAVDVDEIIRSGGTNPAEKQYMHQTLIPLKNIDFKPSGQVDMFINECEGYCAT